MALKEWCLAGRFLLWIHSDVCLVGWTLGAVLSEATFESGQRPPLLAAKSAIIAGEYLYSLHVLCWFAPSAKCSTVLLVVVPM